MALYVEQKVKCCAWAIAFGNITETIRQFQVAYPGVEPSSNPTITKWKNLLLETGSIVNKYSRGSNDEREVCASMLCYPGKPKSLGKFGLETDVPKSSVLNEQVLPHFTVPEMDQSIFQLDGAPPHFLNPVKGLLNDNLHGLGLEQVYTRSFNNDEELKQSIEGGLLRTPQNLWSYEYATPRRRRYRSCRTASRVDLLVALKRHH
ncbi:hypothetical protein J6590_023761 [Homalodisca vitripennis]|nr:hypothetical protein J6590_023761 [Homalodisca vitripennis]